MQTSKVVPWPPTIRENLLENQEIPVQFNLCQVPNKLSDKQTEDLLKIEGHGIGEFHPELLAKKWAARESLRKQLSLAAVTDLKLASFGRILNSPLRYSLSHTQNVAASAMGNSANEVPGIDIEMKNRVLNPKSAKHFIGDGEKTHSYNLLEFWTIKEACFKAASWAHEESIVGLNLKNIYIQDDQYFFIKPINKFGQFSIREIEFLGQSYYLALAVFKL